MGPLLILAASLHNATPIFWATAFMSTTVKQHLVMILSTTSLVAKGWTCSVLELELELSQQRMPHVTLIISITMRRGCYCVEQCAQM